MAQKSEARLSSNITLVFMVVITLSACLIFIIRHQGTQTDAVPVGDRIWKITLSNQFTSGSDPSILHVALPGESPYAKIVQQTISHPSISLKRPAKLSHHFNELTAVPDQAGDHQLTAEILIHASDSGRWINKFQRKQLLNTKQREDFLADTNGMALSDPRLENALQKIRANVTDLSSLEHEIFKYINKRVVLSPEVPFVDVGETLQKKRANGLGKTMAFVALCRASNIPARLVAGIVLREAIDADLHYWSQVYVDEKWLSYDVEHGYVGELPPSYLPLAYDRENIAYFEDPTLIETTIDIETMAASAGMLGKEKKNLIEIIDLTRLEVGTQQLLSVLLILPFGGLITQFFRQIIGINMFGTFSAPLLALAMIYADWITVVVILVVVSIFGLGGRASIAVGLSRVPRLTIIFVLVAMSMAFGVSIMEYFNMNPNAGAVLLPIVILVSLIDRIYATREDYGMVITLHRLGWTIVVAFICFLVFKMVWLRHIVLIHPEIHFFTLAIVLLISLYKKPTLIEHAAFQWMREPFKKKSKDKKLENTSDKKEI